MDRSAGLVAIVALALLTARQPLLTGGFLAGAAAMLGAAGGARLGDPQARRATSRPAQSAAAHGARQSPPPRFIDRRAGHGARLRPERIRAAGRDPDQHRRQYRTAACPSEAPDYFVLDIPRDRVDAFEAAWSRRGQPDASIRTVPALRGAIICLRSAGRDDPRGRSGRNSRRRMAAARRTRADLCRRLPDGNPLTAGDWWAADYDGEPLVSVDAELAEAVDLKIGDMHHHRRAGRGAHRARRQFAHHRLGKHGLQLCAGVSARTRCAMRRTTSPPPSICRMARPPGRCCASWSAISRPVR